jgi:hypothetical protein
LKKYLGGPKVLSGNSHGPYALGKASIETSEHNGTDSDRHDAFQQSERGEGASYREKGAESGCSHPSRGSHFIYFSQTVHKTSFFLSGLTLNQDQVFANKGGCGF